MMRAVVASFALVALFGCATHIEDASQDGEDDDGGESTGGEGTGGPGPTCTFDGATLETAPGPCAEDGLECGEACGECAVASASCFEQRCYHPMGLALQFPPSLMRGLYEDAEGTACTVRRSGVLERVEAAIWAGGAPEVRMDVLLPCEEGQTIARSVTLPAADLPSHEGVHSEPTATTFVLDTPLAVAEGDEVQVVFTAVGARKHETSMVSGISTSDLDPDCRFVSRSGTPPADGDGWDYMARLHIH